MRKARDSGLQVLIGAGDFRLEFIKCGLLIRPPPGAAGHGIARLRQLHSPAARYAAGTGTVLGGAW